MNLRLSISPEAVRDAMPPDRDPLVTIGGVPAYTGFVTNGVTGAVMYFDNGFYKGEP